MKTILIVDDAAFMRISIRNMLQDLPLEIIGEASNGAEAISLCKEHKPDLMTLDITMPKVNGIEALAEIKKINPTTKVIMVSALGNEEMVKQAIILGAATFIVKPFQKETLTEVIQAVM